MNFHELAMLVAHYLAILTGGDVAIIVKKADLSPIGWIEDSRLDDEYADTCIVRALQAKSEGGALGGTCYVYSTCKPTLMCLGMGVRCAVNKFFFIENGELRSLTQSDLDTSDSDNETASVLAIPSQWAPPGLPKKLSPEYIKIALDEPVVWNSYYYIDLVSTTDIRDMIKDLKSTKAVAWITEMESRRLRPITGPSFACVPPTSFMPGNSTTQLRHRINMSIAFSLLDWAMRKASDDLGKNIACVLVDPNGSIISWGFNTNSKNATLHAEVNCIQDYLRKARRPIPKNCVLYTTLQSCEMCSGMLATVARNLIVIYGTTDKALGRTALQARHNGCREAPYTGPMGNPLARANFQRLVSKHKAFAVFETTRKSNSGNTKIAAKARDAFEAGPFKATNPLARFNVALDKAATTALDQPNVVGIIHGYHLQFLELGMQLLNDCQREPSRESKRSDSSSSSTVVATFSASFRSLDSLHATASDLMAWYNGFMLLNSIRTGSVFAPSKS